MISALAFKGEKLLDELIHDWSSLNSLMKELLEDER
jgi:hypothetical protein